MDARPWALGALVLLAPLLAGCLATPQGSGDVATLAPATLRDVPANGLGQRIVAHVGGALVGLPAEARDLMVRVADTGFDGAEPTLGVLSDGTIVTNPFIEGGDLVMSEDHGLTWTAIGDPLLNPKVNLDPWMWVDPATDRIYNAPLYVACSWLSWTDDKGQSWEANPVAGCGLPAHDHQKVTGGPPAPGVATDGYPSVLYYAYNGAFRGNPTPLASPTLDALDGTWVSRSLDGGTSWPNAVRVFDPSPCKSGVNGPVEVAPDGTAYLAKLTCEGVQVAVSETSGGSWRLAAHLTDVGMYPGLIPDPYIATDTASNAYLATPGGDGLLYTAVSLATQRGRFWTEPVAVTPPGVTFTTLPAITAGEPGQVAFAYLGTTDDVAQWERPEPSYARDEAVWHLYYTYTTDLLSDAPTFVTVQVTPDDDPVQRGCIWLYGGGVPCRNLLDFIGMVDHEGRPYIAFSDGCDACSTAADSRDSSHRVAIVEQGRGLTGGLLEALVPVAPPSGA